MIKKFCRAAVKPSDNLICALAALFIYLCNRFFLRDITHGWIGYICRCHLNDFLCPFIVMPCIETILRVAGFRWQKVWNIVLMALLCGLIWEYVIPIFKRSSVSDPIDLLCYLAGAILYAWVIFFSRRSD